MNFQKKLAANEFVVLAEMHTPKGVNISRLVNDGARIKGRVDAVVIPDMDNGIMRMSALAGAVLLKQQGLETVMHMYCRDRNRMALQGDALAAHVLGNQNIIVADSEEMSQSDHSDAATVEDITEVQLIEALKTLQQGKDMSGFELDGSPDFTIGCTLPPCADDKALEKALETAQEKIAAGATFIVTPAVYSVETGNELVAKAGKLGVPVITTVFLIKSLAIAQYIASSEPGSNISEDLIRRIRKSSDRELEGIKIAGETIQSLKEQCQGVLIQTLGWEHKIPEILDNAGF
ncbi:methylenetetrahydrofolate reductase [Desulfomarina profundi]|uniref:Methylenetetrahydrofolate reductase n=1 Tax=Desulfomarina profundi TaxID=2772557 RepID=A0A8D5FRS2_9BACT|nr:methylenetetrahydrofolate reductase [Desulfomarina profundi]BCL60221.1 methylenetetrahydrofolate reductase [Desulfomarina profundi]